MTTLLLTLLSVLPQDKPEKFELSLDDDKKLKMEFVKVKAGAFTMGEGKTARQITLTRDYWIQTTEVTQTQWEAVMGAKPACANPGADLPVEQVSWEACRKFIEKLGEKLQDKKASLPTEAEWEFACRAGTEGKWSYGEEKSKLEHYAWYENNSVLESHPVATRKPNPWGLYDVHGNVWEWCQDWYGEPDAKQATDPKGPEKGTERVIRGGGFEDSADDTRSAVRKGAAEASKQIGFRVVLR